MRRLPARESAGRRRPPTGLNRLRSCARDEVVGSDDELVKFVVAVAERPPGNCDVSQNVAAVPGNDDPPHQSLDAVFDLRRFRFALAAQRLRSS